MKNATNGSRAAAQNALCPVVALTMGDPAGVGPEVIVRAWQDPRVHARCRPLVVGHPAILRRAAQLVGAEIEVNEIDRPEDAAASPGLLPCLKAVDDAALEIVGARIDARGGQAAYDALVCAARLAIEGRVAAITTAPLNKAALWQAGHEYPGHTELLAELCGVDDFAMMLYLASNDEIRGAGGLGVIHVTLHNSLRQVFERLSADGILAKIRLAHSAMRGLKQSAPRIGVCALNPHAGEEGLFGNEEKTIIAPAVERARAEGIDADGPHPADTLMVRARAGEFDGVVAMYHDQGHIALKLLGFHRAVNVTLGLPIVRTSVAHGTAFDLAWRGVAEASSMIEAIRVASLLAEGFS
ncbi:MAG TPA: 4-hydroxythreonine-4-phosphate dehydrogenase PdxA [Pirellulales bacterium]|nr:4-hydroxythreonine-4-phosphate dehydrogenase PdxA [Pirellulales bacterium]